jgi:hypothetical protein
MVMVRQTPLLSEAKRRILLERGVQRIRVFASLRPGVW